MTPSATANWFVAVELHVRSGPGRPDLSSGPILEAPGPAQLRRARRRGLRTAVLARSRTFYGPELDDLVDVWIECDTRDSDRLSSAVTALPGVIAALTSSVDSFVGPAAAAARTMGLRGPTPRTPALSRDKAVARAALAAAGVPDVAWAVVPANDPRLDSPIGYPCVVKPVDGAASWDVRLVENRAQTRALAAQHLQRLEYGRGVRPQHRLLFEQYVPGPLISAEGFVHDGVPQVLAWSDRLLTAPPHFAELAITSIATPPTPAADGFVRDTLAALQYDFGAFHLEFILGSHGPRLVELNPRLIGAGAHVCVDHAAGVDSADHVVARLLGETPSEPHPTAEAAASTQMYLTAETSGRVHAVGDVRKLSELPGVVSAEVSTDVGRLVRPATSSSDYLGHVLTVGATPAQARERALAAKFAVRIDLEETARA